MDQPAPEDQASQKPDWLVGADEGVAAEAERIDRRSSAPAPAPVRLFRPQGDGVPPAPATSAGNAAADHGALDLTGGEPTPGVSDARESLSISRLAAQRAQEAEQKAPEKKPWAQGASSVPKLRLVAGGAAPAQRAPAPVAPPEEEGFLEDDALPAAGAAPNAAPGAAPARAASRPVLALREAWWVIALDAVRTDVRVQLLIGLVVVGIVAFQFLRPREDAPTAIRAIHEHPERYDGRVVTVAGRVGEVYAVGGGYAFHVIQGRDTIVVFSRTRRPEWKSKVTVKGSISTGFLDGVPRQALFEEL